MSRGQSISECGVSQHGFQIECCKWSTLTGADVIIKIQVINIIPAIFIAAFISFCGHFIPLLGQKRRSYIRMSPRKPNYFLA